MLRSLSNKRTKRFPIFLGILLFLLNTGSTQVNTPKFLNDQLHQKSVTPSDLKINIYNESHILEPFEVRLTQTFLTQNGETIQTWSGRSLTHPERSIHISSAPKKAIISITKPGISYQLNVDENSSNWSTSANLAKDKNDCELISSAMLKQSDRKSMSASDLLIYEIALTSTPQFSAIHGNTTIDVLTALLGYVNQINTIYERELGIRLRLVKESEKLIFLDGLQDPFSNQTGSAVVQNIQILNDSIGLANYDIGHLLRGDGGGLANVEVACTINKGFGVSGFESVVNFHLLLAHEIGHQLGAGHSWNSCSTALNNLQRSPSSAMEPGSGSSIMSYAGLCGANNVSNDREPYFHSISIEQIRNYTRSGAGASCPQIITTTNTPPSITDVTPSEKAIPKSTPFVISGNAVDAEGDVLTHAWDQIDQDDAVNLGVETVFNPIIRSVAPSTENVRYIPDLVNLANGVIDQAELLPSMNRAMEFRYVVRDNHLGNGNTSGIDFTLQTDTSAGPFMITNDINRTWIASGTHAVEWEVANTDNALVDCQMVDILIDYEGLLEFQDTLAKRIPNNGLHYVSLPDTVSPNARIMIKAVDNIFFDISDNPFPINRTSTVDFQIYTDTTYYTVCNESEVSYTIKSVPINGFMNPIRYSLTSPITGLTISFDTNDKLPGQDVTLSVVIDNTIERKDYIIPIEAFAANGTTQTINFALRILDNPLGTPGLQSPNDGHVFGKTALNFIWKSDAVATSNLIEISDNPAFESAHILFQDSTSLNNFYTTLSDNQSYFWRIKSKNNCSSSASSSFQTFGIKSTTCNRFSNTATQAISMGIDSISSIINVPIDTPIQSIALTNIRGTHTYIGDLTFVLIAPNGQRFKLVENECNESRNFSFDINPESSRLRCSIDRGLSYRPLDNISDLLGTSALGNWTLRIIDDIPGDGGQLEGWELNICAFDNPSNPMIITADTLKLRPGQDVVLNTSILESRDQDNLPFEIQYIVTTAVTKGYLIQNTDTLRLGDRFNQAEIDNGDVRYVHMNSFDEMDELGYIVTDGLGGVSSRQVLPIAIRTIVNTVSIGEAFGISIFPNPANDHIYIDIPSDLNSNISAHLYDINGKLMSHKILEKANPSNQINLSRFAAGVYLLKLHSDTATGAERIIIHR